VENIDKLAGVLTNLITSIQDTTKEQWPLVATEILTYEAWEAQKCMIIGFVLLALAVFFLVCWLAADSEGVILMTFVFTFAFGLPGVIMPIGSYFTLNKIEKAPKLYLIEYIAAKTAKN